MSSLPRGPGLLSVRGWTPGQDYIRYPDDGLLTPARNNAANRLDDASSISALTYAVWDSENTTRLETPEQYAVFEKRAMAVSMWLRVHGSEIVRSEQLDLVQQKLNVLFGVSIFMAVALFVLSARLLYFIT